MTEAHVKEQVRQRYAEAARAVATSGTNPLALIEAGCCSASGAPDGVNVDSAFGSALYGAEERGELPAEAVAASLGCGNPTAVAALKAGETVLDLGSGGGIDVLLSAQRVGPTGFAYGVDMTEEMLALAQANKVRAGVTNVAFLEATIEDIPLPADFIDVIISNCVINLSTDKPAVLAEMFRVLRPGGRIAVFDVVAGDHLSVTERVERGSYVGCIAGALSVTEYLDGLAAVGFANAEVEFAHEATPGMHGAVVRATKPEAAPCCAPTDEASCCEPSAKSECCGSGQHRAGTCSCQ